jgi:4-hydroxy-tetrahydrodipicolinate synthase
MFKGSLVAMVTPMKTGVTPDTPVDMEALERIVEFHIAQGTDAIVAVGTTGESATLSEAEHCRVIRDVIHLVAGRVPVIGGTGANSTLEAVRLTRCAKDAGAEACLLVTPYYNKPTQEGLFQHHKAVAEAVAIPQILYNVPGRTACDMQPETAARLARVPNIIGIKEATGDLQRVDRIRELCGENFLLVSGDDATACEFILRGGDGVISVTANVAPHAMHEMCAKALAGDRQGAQDADRGLAALHRALFLESNPIPTKWALHRMGLIEAGIRLPLTWFAESCHADLEAAMRTARVL